MDTGPRIIIGNECVWKICICWKKVGLLKKRISQLYISFKWFWQFVNFWFLPIYYYRFSHQIKHQTGHFHDDIIWLQLLPEIVTIFVSLWYNIVIVVRFTKDPNLHKKTKVLSILEVVVKRISSCQNGLQCHLVKNKTPVGQHKSPVLWIKFYPQFWILAKLTLLYFKTKDINGRLTCPVMAKSLTHHMLSWRDNNCPIFFWYNNCWLTKKLLEKSY